MPGKSPIVVSQLGAGALGLCTADRLLLNPKGDGAVVWHERRPEPFAQVATGNEIDKLDIVHFGPRETGAIDLVRIVGPGPRLDPLSWAPDGSALNVLYGGEGLHRIAYADGKPTLTMRLEPAWRDVFFTAATHVDPAPLLAGQSPELRRLKGQPRFDAIYATLSADRMRFAAVAKTPLQSALIVSGPPVESGVPALLLREPLILDEGGVGIFTLGNPERPPRARPGYARPLVDLATGRLAGQFDLQTIDARRSGLSADALARLLQGMPKPFFLRDVSLSGNSIAILYSGMNGEVGLGWAKADTVGHAPFCDLQDIAAARATAGSQRAQGTPSKGDRAAPARFAGPVSDPSGRSMEIVDLQSQGAPSQAFGMLFSAPASRQGDLLVFFHGGPGFSALDGDPAFAARKLAMPQLDFLAVEYSGSAAGGPALLNDLARHGPAAIERDVHALQQWLQRSGYRRVHLIGTSFGSVPLLASLDSRLPVCTATLIAPLLRYRSPDQISRSARGFGAPQTYWRTAFDRSALGGEKGIARLDTWLRAHIPAALDPRVSLFFADGDPLSVRSDLPSKDPAARKIRVLPGTHQSILGSEVLWASIRAEVSKPCGARNG